MVLVEGFEPSIPYGRWSLNPERISISATLARYYLNLVGSAGFEPAAKQL